tara:strand:- start:61 stop:1617 length:1557 start_codon:yes stop_codon:yes gene_type:complete
MKLMSAEKILAYFNRREAAIAAERESPYDFGFELGPWKMADEQLKSHSEILVMGGNRSSKSTWAAKRVVQCLTENPGTIVWCLTETAANSIQFQQAMIFHYLKPEHKRLGRTPTGSLTFSIKNGFTSGKFVLPNKSICIFRNWSQNLSTIEGGEIGCPAPPVNGTHNIGFWADELLPLSWWETIRYRNLTRNAKGIVTFTAVDGWSPTVKSLLTGARTIKSTEAELLPGETVPLIQQPLRKGSSIVYFHTAENPFGGWEAMKATLDGEKRDVILCRAYGVPVKASRQIFPLLSDKNYLEPEKIPILSDPENNPATWITVIDPAGAKPWSIALIGVDAHNVAWVVKEFPDFGTFGAWIDMTGGDKLRAGEAAHPNGYGILDYCEVIREMEGGRKCHRIIDPRLGAASYQKAEGSSNIIDDLADEGITVYPAEALDIETGLQAINNLFSWKSDQPMSLENKPRLMISEECQNTISCLQEYQPGNLKDPSKDFVDLLRYFSVGAFEHFEEEAMTATKPGGY